MAVAIAGCGGDDGSGSTPVPQPSAAELKAAGFAELPLAPEDQRVDRTAPAFSNPTEVTNPLFPISELRSVVLNGHVDGKPFRTETSLLPQTRVIEWTEGERVETVVSQYFAYLDGRVEEVALDYYAQADDGSVWYFGEDVYNYSPNGLIADTSGTWLAGKEGPAAMIMPADPAGGEVHRPENIPGLVFEEVTVKTVDKTLPGPRGPVEGGMVAEELHDDGTFSDKQFAPDYGEFFSAHEGDLEALALAVPTDALGEPLPDELRALVDGAETVFGDSRSGRWAEASAAADQIAGAWDRLKGEGGLPVRLVASMDRALDALEAATAAQDQAQAGQAAHAVTIAGLDLELPYLAPDEVDLARFDAWARRILVDAAAGELGAVTGDLATMEWIRDRFAPGLDGVQLTGIDSRLEALRDAVVDEDLAAAATEAAELRDLLAT